MPTTRSKRSRYAGLLLGVALAGFLLWSGWMPANKLEGTDLPARVTMVSASSELVAVRSAGKFIDRQLVGQAPVREAAGSFTIHNPAGSKVAVRIVTPAKTALGSHLHVSLQANADEIFSGSLAELHEEGSATFTLPDNGVLDVAVRAWIPSTSDKNYQARAVHVPLQLEGDRVSG